MNFMTSDQIRQAYLDFFCDKIRRHRIIPPAPLVPPDDPTTLFTNSGMQQLVPYLKGEVHPMGKRLVDAQPCFRAEDIDEVGDNRHTTFFEMLGNWSLGDYFKKEQLAWLWQFLTKILNLNPDKLHVSVFEGDKDAPKDEESFAIWQKLGVPESRIHYYPAEKNWWSRAGTPKQMPAGEIGGTTSEVFFEFMAVDHDKKFGKSCHPNCDCGRFLEIGNSVFMEYEKQTDDSMKPLPKQNVDFGGGLERLTAAVANEQDVFKTDIFQPVIKTIENVTGKQYEAGNMKSMRVVADHLRAAVFIVATGIEPGPKLQGSVLRRLLTSVLVGLRTLEKNVNEQDVVAITEEIFGKNKNTNYFDSVKKRTILDTIGAEVFRFSLRLDRELPKYIKKYKTNELDKSPKKIIGQELSQYNKSADEFISYFPSNTSLPSIAAGLTTVSGTTTYGLPIEYTLPEIKKGNWVTNLNVEDLLEGRRQGLELHKKFSRSQSAGVFKGGLADQSADVVKLHTATHLLHAALRKVLGSHVRQEGSNITGERLRFDFSHQQALTETEKEAIEKLIKQKIDENLPVTKTIENKDEALNSGAMAFFKETYPSKVSVYTIGDFSKELCGGPHVASTGKIGSVKITKDQSIGAGKRRLYAVLNDGNKKSI
jgi:alanyl-tRNA synthetase